MNTCVTLTVKRGFQWRLLLVSPREEEEVGLLQTGDTVNKKRRKEKKSVSLLQRHAVTLKRYPLSICVWHRGVFKTEAALRARAIPLKQFTVLKRHAFTHCVENKDIA